MSDRNIFTRKENLLLNTQGYLIGFLPLFSIFQIFYGNDGTIFYADIFFSVIFFISSIVSHNILKNLYQKIKKNPQIIVNYKNTIDKYSKKQSPYISFTLLITLIFFGLLFIIYGKISSIYSLMVIGFFMVFYGIAFSKISFLFFKQKHVNQ